MTRFYNFRTSNRDITIKDDTEENARKRAISSVLARLVDKDPFMTPQTFEMLQTGLLIEFGGAKVDCKVY